jgi:short-subunit dehydrogenase
MILRYVWVAETWADHPPKPKFSLIKLVPSLREALQTFSTVVITGGSSGIGKSFIELAAKLKPDLTFCNLSRNAPCINFDKLKLCHIACDLGQRDSVAHAAGEVESFLDRAVPAGRVLLINNSGFGSYGHFPEPNLSHQLEMVDVNIRGLIDLTGRLLPRLKQRGGMIVNVASTASFQPTPYMATYGASKAFVLHWSLAMNQELKGTGVSTLAVCPGPTPTNFSKRAGLEPRTEKDSLSMSSDDVARRMIWAIAKKRSMVVTGWRNRVLAALAGSAPKPLAAWIAAKAIERYRVRRVAR